jgi:hypothetical protein
MSRENTTIFRLLGSVVLYWRSLVLVLWIFRPASSIALLRVDKRWVSCHNCYFCPLPHMYLPPAPCTCPLPNILALQVSRALGAFLNVSIKPNNVSAIAKVGHLIFLMFQLLFIVSVHVCFVDVRHFLPFLSCFLSKLIKFSLLPLLQLATSFPLGFRLIN